MIPTRRSVPACPRGTAALLALALAALAIPATPAAAQNGGGSGDALVGGPGSANYRMAARFAPYKLDDLIYSTEVEPRWIEGTERFWYEYGTSDGSTYWIVDPERGTKRELFDNERLAAELTRITRDPWDAQHLPIRRIRFIDGNTLHFEVESSQDEEQEEEEQVEERDEQQEQDQRQRGQRDRRRTKKKVHYFEYDVSTRTLRELADYESPDDHPSWASVSPDGQTVVFAREHDLWMMTGEEYQKILDARRGKSGAEADSAEWKLEDIVETRLTEDGEEHYGWGFDGRGDTDKEKEENADKRKRAPISWSHDSRRFAVTRSDRREVDELWVIHSVGNDRPELETYKYDMPGEENVTQQELYAYDLATRAMTKIQADAWKDQSLDVSSARQFFYPDSEEPRRSLWLSPSSDELHFVRVSRPRHRIDLVVADPTTGETRVIVEERMNTYMETREPERLSNGDILWWSERDGWAHIYRYGPDGTLKNRLTQGSFSVRDIVDVDERAGVVYLQIAGREAGEDPYYQHLYRVSLDGSGMRLLNPGDYDHRVEMGESARFFVDSYSKVNTVPAATLRDASGRVVLELETADFTKLGEAGWSMPEPFMVKAADGVTDLYGVMYKPFDFDSTKVYPIVAYVYPGPQTEAVSKSFSTNRYETALAQFGFIVITVGNRGGHPSRSKWYHNYGYGNLRDYGLADKKVTIEQLADRHPFIDIDRVGIYGHSGGGFMSTAAMLVYPDFFDVAVSSSGNHDNDVYNRWWSETHHGVKEVVDDSGKVSFDYDIERNSELARNLKGHLLLTTGDIDNNVHPAGTFRMAEALIRANKRFDFFIFPGQRHGYGNMSDYWFWLRAEYFVKHLLGDERWNADIVPLQMETERTR